MYGTHDGSSLLERFIDDISDVGKSCICVGAGNEGMALGHQSGEIEEGVIEDIAFMVQPNQTVFSIQFWKHYEDEMEIFLQTPSGKVIGPIESKLGAQRLKADETEVLLYYGEPCPYTVLQEIYFEFVPQKNYVDEGIWGIRLEAKKIVVGKYEMWFPSESALNVGTGFLCPNENLTLTVPSSAERVITVGAYEGRTESCAPFSGRGWVSESGSVKPDLVAPGVDLQLKTMIGRAVSGTSFATPFVTGSAALLMEWGIVLDNDPYLYGEKVKAYLRKGAKPLPGLGELPNVQSGYGALCVKNSFPKK